MESSNRPMRARICQASFAVELLVIINSRGHFASVLHIKHTLMYVRTCRGDNREVVGTKELLFCNEWTA